MIINPPSNDRINAMSLVTAQKLRQAGVNVDLQAMDIGAWASRRNNRNDPRTDRGGWHIFHTHGKMVSQGSPLSNPFVVATGHPTAAWGWMPPSGVSSTVTRPFGSAAEARPPAYGRTAAPAARATNHLFTAIGPHLREVARAPVAGDPAHGRDP